MRHKYFGIFLLVLTAAAVLVLTENGREYYEATPSERAFMPEHKEMRPSGSYSHGLGVLGAVMIALGVVIYSVRKNVKSFWNYGKLSVWLEVHIILCLLGPILIIYHSTFKASGIAAISLWTMLAVAASGVIGRFLYVLIPRNPLGAELGRGEINAEFDGISRTLLQSEEGKKILGALDSRFAEIQRPRTIIQTVRCYLHLRAIRFETGRWVAHLLKASGMPKDLAHQLRAAADARAKLLQRTVLLIQVEKFFFYWHAIHLPFAIIMLITFIFHVGVALWLGYTWIF
jgi:hypothetical protein